MKIINNTHQILYIYLCNKKKIELLSFGQQIESNEEIKNFVDENEWINYVNEEVGNNDWFNDDIKEQIQLLQNSPCADVGYLTPYNFRLAVNDTTEQYLESLLTLDDNTIEVVSTYGDKYYINKNEFVQLFEQYKIDKPLYLNLVKS